MYISVHKQYPVLSVCLTLYMNEIYMFHDFFFSLKSIPVIHSFEWLHSLGYGLGLHSCARGYFSHFPPLIVADAVAVPIAVPLT